MIKTYEELKELCRGLNSDTIIIREDYNTIFLTLPKPKDTAFWFGKYLGFNEDGSVNLVENNFMGDKTVTVLATNRSYDIMWALISCLAFNGGGV